jgi:hypothetical protein
VVGCGSFGSDCAYNVSQRLQQRSAELRPPSVSVDSMEGLGQEVESRLRAAIVGSNSTVKAVSRWLAGDTGADEVIVGTDTYGHADRLQSYRRLADVATLTEAKPAMVAGA